MTALNSLPDDILRQMLSFLDAFEMCSVSQCNKELHKLAGDQKLWKRLYTRAYAGRTLLPTSVHNPQGIAVLCSRGANCKNPAHYDADTVKIHPLCRNFKDWKLMYAKRLMTSLLSHPSGLLSNLRRNNDKRVIIHRVRLNQEKQQRLYIQQKEDAIRLAKLDQEIRAIKVVYNAKNHRVSRFKWVMEATGQLPKSKNSVATEASKTNKTRVLPFWLLPKKRN